jgi:NADPH-dependent 2,4-dienoyl-CoA reductase/sulfur reductase-like enzyme
METSVFITEAGRRRPAVETNVFIAGAGRSGLHAARLLAGHGFNVTLVERLPAPGGQEPEPDAEALARAARVAGVRFVLGTLAVSLDRAPSMIGVDDPRISRANNPDHENPGSGPGRVHTLGIDGARVFPVDALLVATGTRPATLGELGVTGDRTAGVLPGSAAVHLIESGVLPGWRPVIVGRGDLARHCLSLCLRAGALAASLVSPSGVDVPVPPGVDVYDGWRLVSVHGQPRVGHVVVARDGQTLRIPADAVILAQDRRPMRNIENAVRDAGVVVGCHSSADPKTDDDAVRTARMATERVLELAGPAHQVRERQSER